LLESVNIAKSEFLGSLSEIYFIMFKVRKNADYVLNGLNYKVFVHHIDPLVGRYIFIFVLNYL